MQGLFVSAVIAAGLVALPQQSAESNPRWESDYGRALATTRESRKPLLIVLDKSGDVQHRVDQIAVTKKPAAPGQDASLLEAYELCHVDAATEYGQQLVKAFGVKQLPYLAIIDKTGRKVIYQKSGRLTNDQWQSVLTANRAGDLPQAAPVSYSHLLEPQGFYAPSNCPSCQRGW